MVNLHWQDIVDHHNLKKHLSIYVHCNMILDKYRMDRSSDSFKLYELSMEIWLQLFNGFLDVPPRPEYVWQLVGDLNA